MSQKSNRIRLSGADAFNGAFAGRKIATADLVFYFRPNGSVEGRVGLVVGRKAYAGAVTRNLLKRRLRALYRHSVAAMRGFDVVIVARRGRKEPGFAALEGQVRKLAVALEGK